MVGNQVVTNSGVFKRLAAAWRHICRTVEDTLTPNIQKKIAHYILHIAQQKVPVRTGALRASGRVTKDETKKAMMVKFGNHQVNYAAVVEYGRATYRPFAPRPYIRPAVAMAQKRFKGIAKIEMKVTKGKWPRRII